MSDFLPRATAAAREALGIGDAPDLVVRCRVVSAEAVAKAAAKEVLAALREPSEAMRHEPVPLWGKRYEGSTGAGDLIDSAWHARLDAFERENGLEPPAS